MKVKIFRLKRNLNKMVISKMLVVVVIYVHEKFHKGNYSSFIILSAYGINFKEKNKLAFIYFFKNKI